ARALERLVATAAVWPWIQRNARPVFDVRLVRAAAPLLNGIVTQLRRRLAPPRPVARLGWLLNSRPPPLHRHGPAELRNLLELISRELARDTVEPCSSAWAR